MIQNYIKRTLEPIIKMAVSEFPAVVLTGPRQSGDALAISFRQALWLRVIRISQCPGCRAGRPALFLGEVALPLGQGVSALPFAEL